MTTDKINYASSAAITCQLAPGGTGLANSATVGRASDPVDNSSNLYDDALVYIKIKTGAGALAAPKAVFVYVYASEDGTNYEQEESNSPSADASYTINDPTVFKLGCVINCATSAKSYARAFSVAQLFGGVMPKKWGIIIINNTGTALDTTEANHVKQYTGITYTNS